MDWNALILLQHQNQLTKVLETNCRTEAFGLTLSEADAELILEERGRALKEQRRVEFGTGIAEKLIYEFCDSDFIDQSNYVETILRLQEIFYLYKNEMQDELTDDELLHVMKEQFENLCLGDLDFLEETGLSDYAGKVRQGYRQYQYGDGRGEYAKFDEGRKRYDELYLDALEDLF